MRILIVGNREGWTYDRVRQVLKQHNVYKSDELFSGGADGVDKFVQRYAQEIGATITIVYPDPDIHSNAKFHNRNEKSVLLVKGTGCDGVEGVVIAFNKYNNKMSGTHNTIRYAKQYRVKTIIIDK